MVNRFSFWWMPGLLSIPFILVSPSLGFATLIMTVLILVLLKVWGKRSMSRILYINSEIDKGVIFRKTISMSDQIQYRRKSMVLTYDTVHQYVRSRKLMSLALIFLSLYVVGYATFNWFKTPDKHLGGVQLFTEAYWKQAAIGTTVIVGVLLSLTCLLSYLRIRYFLNCLKEPNLPGAHPVQTEEDKEAAVEKAHEQAARSGGFISSAAHRTARAESEEQAKAKADGLEAEHGSIAAKARMNVSDDRPVMSRDEKIEAAHQAALEAAEKASDKTGN